jgi:hypothetical protein
MVIRIHASTQMARGCKVTLEPGGSTALHYVFRSIALQGWTAHSMGWVLDTDLAIVFVEGAKKDQLTEHLKADGEFDFSYYK